MKNWDTLEPDRVKLMTKHFTPGRGGKKIEHVTLHHMAMVGDLDACVRVWQDRLASAHYCISPSGEIGQAVWDRDTAWSNTNSDSNQRSLTIEHSNSAGPNADWPISEATLEEGAHLVAAICKFYKLGRPASGKNVRFHNVESGGTTACPYHLRPGHKYHDRYIARAQHWYDQMTGAGSTKISAPAQKGPLMALTDDEQRRLLEKVDRIHHELTHPFQSRYVDPQGAQSPFRETLAGYLLELDRKIEDIHANMLPTMWERLKNTIGGKK